MQKEAKAIINDLPLRNRSAVEKHHQTCGTRSLAKLQRIMAAAAGVS